MKNISKKFVILLLSAIISQTAVQPLCLAQDSDNMLSDPWGEEANDDYLHGEEYLEQGRKQLSEGKLDLARESFENAQEFFMQAETLYREIALKNDMDPDDSSRVIECGKLYERARGMIERSEKALKTEDQTKGE